MILIAVQQLLLLLVVTLLVEIERVLVELLKWLPLEVLWKREDCLMRSC